MKTENNELTPEQNKIATALNGFYLQYKTTTNLERINQKLKTFIMKNNILPELSALYDKISSGDLSSNLDICNEIRLIYQNILGRDMNYESSQSIIVSPEQNASSATQISQDITVTPADHSPSLTGSLKTTHIQGPKTLAEKLKVDIQTTIHPPIDNNFIVNDNSLSFTRADGSKVTVEVLNHVNNLYHSQLHNCRITQVFPSLPYGSDIEVITNVTTSINLNDCQSSPEYKAQLKSALSAQNIYDAAVNHNSFLYKGLPAFNLSNELLINYTEEIVSKERFSSCVPFDSQDGVRKKLLPIGEFNGPSPLAFAQYEYSVSGFDFPDTTLKYIYSNINIDKLYSDCKYKDFVLSQIKKAENTKKHDSFFLISSPNLQGEYTAITDLTLTKFIEAYQQYLDSHQLSNHDSTSGDHR